MNAETLAALECGAYHLEAQANRHRWEGDTVLADALDADAALIRALIKRERAGGEQAAVVAYLKGQACFWRRDGNYGMQGVIDNLADAIEAGAHMAGAAKERE